MKTRISINDSRVAVWRSWFVPLPALALLAAGCGASDGGPTAQSQESALTDTVVKIDWSMPDMFGNDFNGDGLTDIPPIAPSDPASSPVVGPVMRPSAWKVQLDGCASTPASSYAWDVALPSGPQHIEAGASCSVWTQLPQGTFNVTLTLTLPDGSSTSGSQWVTVKNYLIVSMGDSIASGEGAPDVKAVWSGAGWRTTVTPARWVDKRCHRSANSGHAQAALALERSDKHSSVRFVSFACSGATIDNLINPGYMGIEPAATDSPLPAQIEAVRTTICPLRGSPPGTSPPPCAPIDSLLVTVGANDLNFGSIVATCANPFTDCEDSDDMVQGMQATLELPQHYDALDTAIRQSLDVKQIYFAEYQDPTHDDSGNFCQEMVFTDALADEWVKVLGPLPPAPPIDGSIDSDEVVWAYNHILHPLNSIALAAAQRRDWKYIGGIGQAFKTHGYCANDRFIDTYSDSKTVERVQDGTMHPNDAGYGAIASVILPALAEDSTLPRSIVSSAPLPYSAENHLLMRGLDNAIYAQHWDGASWDAGERLGGAMSSTPVAVATAWNQAFTFAIDQNGVMQRNAWTQWWNGWQALTQQTFDPTLEAFETQRSDLRLLGKPAVVQRPDGGTDVFARGDDDRLWHLSFDSNGNYWGRSAWEPLNAPPFIGTPSVVANGPNRFDLILRGADQAVWHGWENAVTDTGGDWNFESLGGAMLGNPKVVAWGPSRLDIFVVGTDNTLYHHWYDSTGWGWGYWESLGLSVSSDPEVVSSGFGSFDIFVRGPSQSVWHRNYGAAGWGDWQATDLAAGSGIVADARGPDMLDIFSLWPGAGVYNETFEGGLASHYYWIGGLER